MGVSRLLISRPVAPHASPTTWRSLGGSWRGCRASAPATEARTFSPEAAAPGEVGSNGAFRSTAYPFTAIEAKWQAHWEAHQTFRTPDFKDLDTNKPKFYALDMFPYPR